MSSHLRHVFLGATVSIALGAAGCATSKLSTATSLVADSQATVEGSIASIDTAPWSYDGNAVVVLDTAGQGRVAVQLPARWNLCKAAPVDVASLAVGRRVRAVGTVGAEGELVVCERAEHRLAPVD